ncbi:MAG: DNA primase [Pseudomonadota bacterium]
MIPPRFLDEIRNRLTLSDIIGRRVKVTRAGREFKACCPFHKEKTPSFTINDDKQFYHCFGCGAHGDVIGFVMRNDNLSFMDAVEGLAAEAGLQMPKPDPEAMKKAERQKDLYDLVEDTTKWFEYNLSTPENAAIMEYVQGRGLNEETIAGFRVGFAPNDRQGLRKHLKQKGYTEKDMIEAGVLRPPGKDGEPYDFFRGRVMFPVTDKRGRVVAFGGRTLPDHLRPPERGDYTPAKYMNSSDNALFDKGRMLYGEAMARQAVADGQPLIVTEGYMDVIACHQVGFKGAVAPMGTALTDDQIMLLWKMIRDDEKVPILCFDGDNAGQRAASRAVERVLPLLQAGQSVKIAFLPDGEDPDTLIKKSGAQAFKNVLDAASSMLNFLWSVKAQGRDLENPETRAGFVKSLYAEISKIADKEVQTHYKSLIQKRISETFFSRNNNARNRRDSKYSLNQLKVRKPTQSALIMNGRILLAALINHPALFLSFEEDIGRAQIADKTLNDLKQYVINALIENPALESDTLRRHLIENGHERLISDILSESVYVHAGFARPNVDLSQVSLAFAERLKEVEMLSKDFQQEINQRLKQAVSASNEDQESQLIEMVGEKLSE